MKQTSSPSMPKFGGPLETVSTPVLVCHTCGHRDVGVTLGARCPNEGSAMVPDEEHLKAPKDTVLGRVVGGKYPVVGLIGAGGMGAVYRALQEPVGREVALKVVRDFGDKQVDSQTLRARFFREAKVVAKLSNPAAVTLYDYGMEDDGVLYMVLELVRGVQLSRLITAGGNFNPERAVALACQVLNALAEAHSLGLIHRDLKPDNIMVVRGPWGEEQAKVLDFGIAKVRAKENENTLETRTGFLLGTPLYMSPEQALARGAEPGSDLYSLGAVLYEMLCGQPPFLASTVFEVLLAHREKPVPPFPEDLGIPPALEAVIFKALEKLPENRFPDAGAMAQALLDAVPVRTAEKGRAIRYITGAQEALSSREAMVVHHTPIPPPELAAQGGAKELVLSHSGSSYPSEAEIRVSSEIKSKTPPGLVIQLQNQSRGDSADPVSFEPALVEEKAEAKWQETWNWKKLLLVVVVVLLAGVGGYWGWRSFLSDKESVLDLPAIEDVQSKSLQVFKQEQSEVENGAQSSKPDEKKNPSLPEGSGSALSDSASTKPKPPAGSSSAEIKEVNSDSPITHKKIAPLLPRKDRPEAAKKPKDRSRDSVKIDDYDIEVF